ncbi:hypothetical protein Pfo_019019 [Paulownia fortunei]|nr:hypothetical protein Pfo_019019 [Paulownia fortunei]
MSQRKPTESPTSPILSSSTNNSEQFLKSKFFFISMAALLSFALLSLLLFFTISSASRHHKPSTDNPPSDYDIIYQVCKASRDPSTCQASLSQSNRVSPDATVLQVIQSALWVSSQNLNTGLRMVRDILDASAGNQNRSDAAKTCLEVLHYSEYRMNLVGEALPRVNIKDARAWMSAALAYQYGCWSGLKYVNDTSLVDKTMAFFYSSLMASSSDALGMMANYDVFGDKTGSWGPPKTERDGFVGPGSDSSGSGPVGGVPSGLKANVTVCKGGHGCDYETVQQAVNATPDNAGSGKRFVIWIKTGVYEETVRIPLEKKNVVLLGDGMGKTVITGSMNVGQQGVSTYNSATVGVLGDGFMASGLTIQNTAGADAHQAVAFRSDSDLSVIENCEFISNQDTLYAHSLRQYYKSCRIQGNIDFIFGNSAALFQDCLIFVASRQVEPEKGENNAVTAHGRIDPAQSTGFVFQNCVINGTDAYMALYYTNPTVHKNFLGRPWKEYSRTVFIHCTLEALITPDGWMPWNGDFALKTLYYGEFENTGPGSNTSKRVSWSSQIPAEHAYSYSVHNFIQGDQWIPTSS